MKYLLMVSALFISASASADQYVQGYQKQDGTYVQPYIRTTPDSNPYNNYSTQGNTNPYTGQQGNVNPVQQQPYYQLPVQQIYIQPAHNNRGDSRF